MAEVFHNGKLKLEWDHTIEADKKLETLDEFCAVYHQILKRVWPTAQRDVVYASHKQKVKTCLFAVYFHLNQYYYYVHFILCNL